MGIGVSLFLISVGAILAFAVTATFAGIDIQIVGWILMVVGVVGLIFTMTLWGRRRRTTVVERRVVPPTTTTTNRVIERDIYDDGPP